jgi:hypothetical protein
LRKVYGKIKWKNNITDDKEFEEYLESIYGKEELERLYNVYKNKDGGDSNG